MAKRKSGTKNRRGRRFAFTKATIQHNAKVSEIVWASNMLHGCLAIIFQELIDKPFHAKAMWDTLSSDQAQRKLLRAWIEQSLSRVPIQSEFPDTDYFLKEILWVIREADSLTNYRNAFVHTPVGSIKGQVIADMWSSKETHAHNIRIIEEKQWFVAIRNDYYDLWEYARAIIACHIRKIVSALPERPQLRGPPSEAPYNTRNIQNQKKTKRPSRRQSSRA